MFGVWQAAERQPVLFEIAFELLDPFRPHHQNGHILFDKPLELLTQLRHVRTAEGSGEAAVENQQHILAPPKLGQLHFVSLIVIEDEIGRRLIDSYFDHVAHDTV